MISVDANTYDAVPYRSLAYAQTHPDRLATVARMFGLSPIDITRCRVLELGCASGGNLIPMAFNLPDSTFVGIDLSSRQVGAAQDTIAALGLKNVTITQTSILDVDKSWGEFDYIICHGVFSWVPANVQAKILEIAAQNLSPAGVAFVSYNTYPGWHMREMVRHMMLYHAGRFDEPKEQIEQARALLAFLSSVAAESGPYGQLLNQEVERLSQAPDSYLYHEHLEQTNAPIYFHQFIDRAEQAGLQYLSEADISDMLSSVFPPAIAETLERISPDILHLEQYMDFVRNRLFRQTLLCHKRVRPKRALTPTLLHGLLVSSPALAETDPPDLAPGTAVAFIKGTQRATVTLPASKAAMAILQERWPEAVDVDELCALAVERAAPHIQSREEARRSAIGDLFGAAMHGMISVHTVRPACTNRLSERPRVSGYVAFQAREHDIVANARHEMVRIDPLTRELLQIADGERTKDELRAKLFHIADNGGLTVTLNNTACTDLQVSRTVIATAFERSLASLVRAALLTQ
jgi:methyltransferase-like protein/SAM-dependent methyltransferase